MERARVNQRPKKYSAIRKKRAFDDAIFTRDLAAKTSNIFVYHAMQNMIAVRTGWKEFCKCYYKNNELGN